MVDRTSPAFAALYDEAPLWSARFGMLLFAHLPLRHGLRVLDLGCGTGFPLFELANMLGESCKLTGVDIWENALQHADAKRQFYGFNHVNLVKASGAALPFADAEFDLIVSNLGLNNFEEPLKTAKECARVLKPDGRLVLTTNTRGHMREFYNDYRAVLKELGLERYLSKLQESEDRRASLEAITNLFREAGLGVEKQVQDVFRWRFLDGSALFRHSFIQVGFVEGWQQVLAEDDVQQVFSALERHLNQRAAKEGGLALTIPMLYVEARKT